MSRQIQIRANSTLYDALQQVIEQCPEDEALVLEGTRKTYAQLGRLVDALASGLSRLGISHGDNVALILPVCLENIYAFFALARLGAPFVPISPQLRAFELRHILDDSEAAAVITIGNMMGHDYVDMIQALRPGLPNLKHVIVHGEGATGDAVPLEELLGAEHHPPPESLAGPADLVGLMYTSGTTGLPKGAMHTHRSMLTQVAVVLELFGPDDLAAMLNHFPMFHLSGIAAPMIFLLSGGKLVLAERFHPIEALNLIGAERISFTVGAPATAQLMLKMAQPLQHDLSSLRVFGMGGSLCPPELIRALKERWDCAVFNGLGISEAGFVSTTRPDDPERVQANTVGRPAKGVDLRIVNDEHRDLPVGEEGEIVCRSPMVMEGYYKRPDETAEVLDADGWYHTGDIGSLDEEGYLSIFDRKKDVIHRGGESLYPAEIERYLVTHPQIKMAAVIGVPSPVGGERVRAYILPLEGAELTEIDVVNYCRGRIATYKIPAEVRIVESFPLSALWKVQKFQLREEALQEMREAGP
ncbi:class I adenylate-forming enzyme family protein [Chloroflexota bacterium]